jgi:hypothetical protein
VSNRKNPQMRKRYDRHEALADPGRAVRRAATEAAVQSVVGLGKGLLDVSALAVGAIKNRASAMVAAAVVTKTTDHETQQQRPPSPSYRNDINDDNETTAATTTTPPPTTSSSPPSQQLLP